MTVVLSDSFNRANSLVTMGNADTGQTWAPQAGTWGINSNQAYSVSASSGDYTLVPAGTVDQIVQADVSSASAAFLGVLASADSSGNFYLTQLAIVTGTLDLYRCVSGGFALLAQTGTALTSATLTLSSLTAAQAVSLNGSPTLTATDSAVTRSTSAGFRLGGSFADPRWDNLTVDDGTVAMPPHVAYQNPVYRM